MVARLYSEILPRATGRREVEDKELEREEEEEKGERLCREEGQTRPTLVTHAEVDELIRSVGDDGEAQQDVHGSKDSAVVNAPLSHSHMCF